MLTVLALLTCVGAGIIGGVFYAFSTFVMQALAQLPPQQGMTAMQRINVAVLNPWFLGVFMATALLALACAIAAFLPWTPYRSPWLLAGGLLYLGTFLITGLRNVPLNERLAHLDAVEGCETRHGDQRIHHEGEDRPPDEEGGEAAAGLDYLFVDHRSILVKGLSCPAVFPALSSLRPPARSGARPPRRPAAASFRRRDCRRA